ncbi:hypothetical protein BDB00DRAFT_310754 [Zychaea mexicana]|uniref:uncharacterized protein n=1 Tax=Zychaea mexicana TaxID=64656 RepID=UPI0022FEBD7A|nr:uncharacterized protein BDB00DRAFT_310754 [Zychaea mexicana]KAI9494309.1 hypothetical protein BDB00DRAFT_310754 [Zychaea mexicana]
MPRKVRRRESREGRRIPRTSTTPKPRGRCRAKYDDEKAAKDDAFRAQVRRRSREGGAAQSTTTRKPRRTTHSAHKYDAEAAKVDAAQTYDDKKAAKDDEFRARVRRQSREGRCRANVRRRESREGRIPRTMPPMPTYATYATYAVFVPFSWCCPSLSAVTAVVSICSAFFLLVFRCLFACVLLGRAYSVVRWCLAVSAFVRRWGAVRPSQWMFLRGKGRIELAVAVALLQPPGVEGMWGGTWG